ncbi:hypothetical protein GON26_20565 [Flavobacterium sp. GA093]|uniref:Uncharacterized protein n=1 Tax=Flavobacterium hydrocarbonoxydans TaxID=2683249 RepID=A0A6I4NUJ3_9FLAO|nr:hypothetical protein [Flavobacterium hydrocarbonoxydans]MWB96762.1 hypothetical protein [Flavobacterium hydrocarbonoxydans]
MWYKINLNVLAIQLLPTFLRKPNLIVFIQALISPIVALYDKTWSSFREENIFKLNHNGQVCYLRKSLNYKFDQSLKRIKVVEGQLYDTTYIYTENESPIDYIHPQNSNPEQDKTETIWLRNEAETGDTGVDFRVLIPIEFKKYQEENIITHINFYKAGGKRYKISYF